MSYTKRRQVSTYPYPQAVALLLLGLAVFPSMRWLAAAAVCFCLAGLIGFAVYRRTARSKRQRESQAVWLASAASAPAVFLPSEAAPLQSTEELIRQLRSIDWFQFEKVVAVAYRRSGFRVKRLGGANPDGGIDLVIEKEGQQTAIQCKQWKTRNVGVKVVRELLGALTDAGLQRGMFVTLNGCTGEARQLADKHGIGVLNETDLASLLESVGARYDQEVLEILKDTTKYCPKCECAMVIRTAARGRNPGSQFWGCSGYPNCRYSMPVA